MRKLEATQTSLNPMSDSLSTSRQYDMVGMVDMQSDLDNCLVSCSVLRMRIKMLWRFNFLKCACNTLTEESFLN